MCGRYVISSPPDALRALLGYEDQPNFPARYNVAPTQPVPIVRLFEGRRRFALVRWGLIPPWVKDPRVFSLLINARAESVLDKPAFRNAMKRRRCLFPADGFYEWQADGAHTPERKRPYFIRRRDRAPLAFAGLWETWMGPNGEEVETAAIVTTTANRALRMLHDRMPVILAPESFELWLAADVDARTAAIMLAPAPDELLEAYEISTAVNRTANDSAQLIEPAVPADERAGGAGAEPQSAAAARTKKARRKKDDDRQTSLF
jgi:putative SOS response-associated peptidase YedK